MALQSLGGIEGTPEYNWKRFGAPRRRQSTPIRPANVVEMGISDSPDGELALVRAGLSLCRTPKDSTDSFALIPAVRVAALQRALSDSPDSSKRHWLGYPRNPLKLGHSSGFGPEFARVRKVHGWLRGTMSPSIETSKAQRRHPTITARPNPAREHCSAQQSSSGPKGPEFLN